jgi:hypothetical protein
MHDYGISSAFNRRLKCFDRVGIGQKLEALLFVEFARATVGALVGLTSPLLIQNTSISCAL